MFPCLISGKVGYDDSLHFFCPIENETESTTQEHKTKSVHPDGGFIIIRICYNNTTEHQISCLLLEFSMISIPYIMTKKMIDGDGVARCFFQYGKGEIKRPVSSDELEKANGTSALGRTTATQHKSSDTEYYADQETVRALTAALKDAETRCQVLQETLAMVSDDFLQSARDLVEANLKIEQLEFKMQAVTFWDSNDRDRKTSASPTAVVDLTVDAQEYYFEGVESDLHKTSPSKRSNSRGQRQRYAQIVTSSYEEDDSDEDTSDSSSRGSWSSSKRQNPKHTRDKSQEQKRSQKKQSQDTDDDSDSASYPPPEELPITPRQAAFVRVMWERDLAQAQARQLTQILLEKREECFYLSQKLSKTTTLVELAYQDDDVYGDQDTGRNLLWRPGSSDGSDLSWLTTDGTDRSTTSIDDNDPELSAIEMQLDLYCSIDIDRAAGLTVE
jgi:hypothetical protein